MPLERLILLAVIVACIVDLERSWCDTHLPNGPFRVLLVTDGPSHEVEGFVRYLYWEFSVRNRLSTEIAVEIRNPAGECMEVRRLLVADGFVVDENSGEPAVVFII